MRRATLIIALSSWQDRPGRKPRRAIPMGAGRTASLSGRNATRTAIASARPATPPKASESPSPRLAAIEPCAAGLCDLRAKSNDVCERCGS
jgi:hypothetical protein